MDLCVPIILNELIKVGCADSTQPSRQDARIGTIPDDIQQMLSFLEDLSKQYFEQSILFRQVFWKEFSCRDGVVDELGSRSEDHYSRPLSSAIEEIDKINVYLC